MPKLVDKLSLKNEFLDKRTKLLPCQREMVHYNFDKFGLSINHLSRIFKVNKRLIQFELFPERKLLNINLRKARGGWSQYYEKDAHAESMKNHRDNKDVINNQFNLIQNETINK